MTDKSLHLSWRRKPSTTQAQTIKLAILTRLKGQVSDDKLAHHYFFPSQSDELEDVVDRDQDGVVDGRDTVFNITAAVGAKVPTSVRVATFPKAIGNLALILRTAHMFDDKREARTAWSAHNIIADGTYVAEAGDDRGFAFSFDATTSTLRVRMAIAHATLDEKALSYMLAIEAAQFFADQAGCDASEREALPLAMIERLRHQTVRHFDHQDPGLDWVYQRYGIDRGRAQELMASLGDPYLFSPADLSKLRRRVGLAR